MEFIITGAPDFGRLFMANSNDGALAAQTSVSHVALHWRARSGVHEIEGKEKRKKCYRVTSYESLESFSLLIRPDQ